MTEDKPVVRKSSQLTPQPTRRQGIRERRLLFPKDSPQQNIVLIDADEGAKVEIHEITTSESIYVLMGSFEVTFEESGSKHLGPGDLCHFRAGTSHGLCCIQGPGQFLAVFAPGGGENVSGRIKTGHCGSVENQPFMRATFSPYHSSFLGHKPCF